MENQNNGEQNGSLSDIETDEENEEGDYTVYECPGLAPVSVPTSIAYLYTGFDLHIYDTLVILLFIIV